ncbi:MAG: AI-2E family transporter [Patescibacteria group bacterium]
MKSSKIEISLKTIFFTVLFLILIYFLFAIRDILLLIFISLICMSALSPLVDRLEQKRIPRAVGILFFYVLIWGFISFGVAALVPPLVEQTTRIINILPQGIEQITQGRYNLQLFEPQLNALPQQLLQIAVVAFNNVLGLFTFMVILFYLIMERANLKYYLTFLFGESNQEKHAEIFVNKLEQKLGSWVRGELILMLIVGLMSYIGLMFLGIEFAIPLAFLAGLLEIVPNIGPTVAAIPAILVALGHSPVLALAVTALYFLIQQLENNFIVPKVMSRAVGLSPLVVIISLLIGLKIAGLAGAILAVPAVLLLEMVVNDIYRAHFKNR